jgi:hypothetical protein
MCTKIINTLWTILIINSMTKEEAKQYLIENSTIVKRAIESSDPNRKAFVEHAIQWEMDYQNSEYGKNHKYPEIPIDEVD